MIFSVTDYGLYQVEYSITFDYVIISIIAENFSGSKKIRILNGFFLEKRLKRARRSLQRRYKRFNRTVRKYADVINVVEEPFTNDI